MEFEIVQEDCFPRFRFRGAVTGGDPVTKFHDCIGEKIDEGFRMFIVNLAEVSWINSDGLGMLIAAMTTVKNAGGRLVLCNTSGIDAVLKITRLKSVFEIYVSETQALEALQGSGSAQS